MVLESVPYTLSVSPLDCESLDFMYAFDYTYRGNHHALLANALGLIPAFEKMTDIAGHQLVSNDPAIQFALDDDCRTQCRVSIESRTSAYHIRTGEFPEEQLSVYLTLRRYGSLDAGTEYVDMMKKLQQHASNILDDYLIESVLQPLQHAIAIQ